MNAGQFRPHGVYSVRIEGRLLVVETSGPWNRELIEAFGLDTINLIQQLAGAPWGVLATVSRDGMHTPDSYRAMVEGIRRQQAIGRCASAVVLKDLEAPATVQTILQRMYREAGERHAFFDNCVAARAWLLEQLPQA